MIFTTQIELNITIKDINAIYSTEYEQMLIDHAKILYEGKCRDGQYIKSIDRLIKRSLPNLIKRDLSAKTRVYIVVEATVIRYDQYDFITGMKIDKIITAGKIGNFDLIQCTNDHVVCLMRMQQGIEQFKVGDVIPVRVGQSMYKIGNAHILVNGYPFLPYVPDQVCYSIPKHTPEVKTYYQNMIAPLINRELAKKETLDKARWSKFANLLYPYKSKSTKNGDIDILDIDAIQNGSFGIDYTIDMTKLRFVSADKKPSEDITIISEDAKIALTRIAFQFVKWISVINDLTTQYGSDEEYNRYDHIWALYTENKL
jgi:hypothetical protein